VLARARPAAAARRRRPAAARARHGRRRGRGRELGTALSEALADEAAGRFSALTLNVHVGSPAVRLYTRTGFTVAGAGGGPLGVAMTARCAEARRS